MSGNILHGFEVGSERIGLVGGKGARLGDISKVHGVRVPRFFCITTEVYRKCVEPKLSTIRQLAEEGAQKGSKEATGDIDRYFEKLHIPDEIREDIENACSGDICAIVGGRDIATGDTLCDRALDVRLEPPTFPEPVISMSVEPRTQLDQDRLSGALRCLTEEDPTFFVSKDKETGQTIISGMGELHLEIIRDRLMREFKVAAAVGKPQIAYRETITQPASFDYTHKKQTGGAGQFGRVIGFIEPLGEGRYQFLDTVKGGHIPREFIPSCDKGFQACLDKGQLLGFPIIGVKVTLEDC